MECGQFVGKIKPDAWWTFNKTTPLLDGGWGSLIHVCFDVKKLKFVVLTQLAKNLAVKLSVSSWIAKHHQHVSFKIAYVGLDWSSERVLLLHSFAGNDSW